MKIVVTVPTYNEIENIEALVADILSQDERIEVLVADDNSPDGTWEAVAKLGETNPRVHLLHRTTDRGRGRAGAAAYAWALDQGADYAFEMDADFSHHPRYLPAMIVALENGADVVLGSRHVPGGKDIGRSLWRQWLTRASNGYVQLILGMPVADCNSGFRGWSRRALELVRVRDTFSPGPAIVHELLYKARMRNLKMTEIPIEFVDRELGTSTLSFKTLIRSYVTIMRLRFMGLAGTLFNRQSELPS